MIRTVRNIIGLLGLAATVFGLSAAPALAAPQFGVTLERDEAEFPVVYHSDERVDFTVNVKNEAAPPGAPSAGAALTCVTSSVDLDWGLNEFIGYRFQFRWLRDGTPLGPWSAADTVIGEEGANDTTYISRYTVQAADAEGAIQCLVKGTTGTESGSAVIASQPAIVVDPQPAVAPPTPNDPEAPSYSGNYRGPAVSGTADEAGHKLTCTAPPTSWSTSNAISLIAWSFEWLRDGEPAPGTVTPLSATESEYELTAEDASAPAAPAVFQCIAKATNAGGHSTVAESFAYLGQTKSPAPEFVPFFSEHGPPQPGNVPRVENAVNTTSGPVTLELELPGGDQTFAYKALNPTGFENRWSCIMIPASAAQHAKAVCTQPDLLRPQEEYNALEVITALGADAPDLGTARATVFGGGAETESDEVPPFPIEPALPFGLAPGGFTARPLDDEAHDYVQAAGHPSAVVSDLLFNRKRVLVELNGHHYHPTGQLRQLIADLPPGFLGNPLAVPALCPGVEEVKAGECPPASAVGSIRFSTGGEVHGTAIYAVEPEAGAPALFAFTDGIGDVFTLIPRLRPADGYAISLEVAPAPEVNLLEATTTFCAFGFVKIDLAGTVCKKAGDFGANPKSFLTNPTRCGTPLTWRPRLNSWADPTFLEGPSFASPALEGCEEVPFEPTMQVSPTTALADSPTGLDVELTMPTEGLEKALECHQEQGNEASPLAAECLSEANLREAKVTLPEGLAVNPAGANGLAACTEAQVGISHSGVPNDAPAECPVASRIGSAEVVTPLLEKPLDGAVYQAAQDQNPFGSTLAIYLVAELPERGVRIKLPGKVELDPTTGQITSTFAEAPQQPFASFKLSFFGGATAPLRTPATCGEYSTTSVLTPYSAPESGPPVTATDPYSVSQSPGGGDCPTSEGALPHTPEFDAGTVTPIAAAYSPLVVRLSREDGSQRFASLKLTPPPGLTAKLAGTPPCPEAALVAAEGRDGTDEQANPSCPAASHLGTAHVATGAGPAPYWAQGEVYLAGPYKGAPLSLAILTPAVAGPFDLGTVLVRTALHLDPATAQITASSDPIPQILEGIPLDVRTVAVDLDRPSFTRNGTSCDPLAFTGELLSTLGQSAPLSERFQLAECGRLGFKPKVNLTLKGGTHRADYQGLRAVVQAREGDANIGRTAVTLPHAAFLAQNHIRTVCTRVQFAADQCPAGSIYGRATATTPLLDNPLSGPVYLRSSDNPLPDLVVKLKGPDSQPIEIDLAGRTDSVRGALRNTFDLVPDAPVSRFTLELFGGHRGLIELSTDDYCARPHRATINLGAQNGLLRVLHPLVRNPHCGKRQRKGHHRGARRGGGMSAARQSG